MAPTVLVMLLAMWLVPHARLFEDDYIQLGILEGIVDGHGSPPFDLYRFLDGTREQVRHLQQVGPVPWFMHQRARVFFFRPLASALLTAEHELWGRWPVGYLLTSLICYLTLVLLLGALVRGALDEAAPPGGAASLATLASVLLVFSSSHWYVVAYSAARWSLLSVTLGLAALNAHLGWRRRGRPRGRLLALILFLAALGAGEMAFAMLGYLVAFELVAAPGGLARRGRALIAYLVVSAVYLGFYRGAGYGSTAVGVYIDPWAEPLRYLLSAPGRLLALFGEQLVGVPAMAIVVPESAWMAVLAGAAGLVALVVPLLLLHRAAGAEHTRLVRWIGLGTLLSALPAAVAVPQSRLLLPLSLGTTVLLALAIHGWWTILRRRPGASRWVAGACALGLAAILVGLGSFRWVTKAHGAALGADAWAARVRQAPWVAPDGGTVRAVFLTPDLRDGLHALYARRFFGAPVPASYWVLSMADAEHHYRRSGERTLELELRGGRLLGSLPEKMMRPAAWPLAPGDTVRLDGLEIEIVAAVRGEPSRLRFVFDRSLDDPSLRLLAVREGVLRRVSPPAPGETIVLSSPWI